MPFPFPPQQLGPAQLERPSASRAVAHPEGVRGGTSSPLDRSNGHHTSPFHRGRSPPASPLSQLRPRLQELASVAQRRGYLSRRTCRGTLARPPRPQSLSAAPSRGRSSPVPPSA